MIPNQNILPGRSRWANYLAIVTPFQTLTPLAKCCFKNAKVRSPFGRALCAIAC
ncbi:hypothetical protein [Nostoc sp. FACHB-133]|uniref:hypothetical protein n=1 Tax=Nostoc sp. FACHB-133 TaxID=2692835 RepID=UPI001A7E2533|nr:hypothetical protein [Nostoc sp. FACHB-133]